MKWLISFLLFFIIYVSLPRYFYKQLSDAEVKYENKDTRVEKLENFFAQKKCPFSKYAKVFIQVADKYKMDWKLLPVVSMVESTGGKNYIHNGFGWGSDSIDYGSDVQDIDAIAHVLTTSTTYKAYQENQNLETFARIYNSPFAESYLVKLRYFYNQL